jgi:multiple sugar transport system substrate-binding protein
MRITVSLTLIFLLAALSACTRNPQPHQKQLTLAVPSGGEGEALKQAARDYEAQTNVHIDIAQLPYQNLFEKELIDLKSRTGAYDLIMLDDPWFPRFASEQLLTDLTPLLQQRGQSNADSDFVATSIALCRHPYRKDLFEKHSLKPPATWDDVLAAAKTIHEKESAGANGGQIYGYVMRAEQGNAAVADFMPIFWAFGGEMFDASGKPAVNSPEGIAALQFMIELGKYSPPGYVSFNASDVGAHLLQGTAAMSINWPVWISPFSDPAKSRVIGKMEFTTLPSGQKQGQAEIGNWLIAIPRDSGPRTRNR